MDDYFKLPPEQKLEQREQVIAVAQGAVEKHPDSADIQTSAARVMIQTGEYDQALAYADKAEQLAPNDPFPMVTKGVAAYYSGDMELASAQAQRVLELDPGNKAAFALHKLTQNRSFKPAPEMAASLLEAARPQSLKELLESPELKAAGDAAVARQKAVDLLDESSRRVLVGDYREAAALAGRALEADPRFTQAHLQRGWTLATLKDHEGAEKHLDRAIQQWSVAPGERQSLGRAYHARAQLNIQRGRGAKALADAERAVRYHPGGALTWAVRAEAKQALGRKPQEWLADFARAAELDPGNYGPRYDRAVAAARQLQAPKGRLDRIHAGVEVAMGRPLPPDAIPLGLGGLGLLAAGVGAGLLLSRR